MDCEATAHGCEEQAAWAAKLGSPMYEELLRRMAEDVRASGPCLAALRLAPPRIAPLMLLGAIHRMVLEGRLTEATRYYPSAGGQVDVEALWPHFLEAVPQAAMPPCLQTNEIGRARALLPGFLEVVRRIELPLRLLEIGASAGLNLRWDHFPFLDVPATVRVAERRGCDLSPIDPTLEESRAALLGFVWPDQAERLQQLEEVLEIARRVPAPVDRCDALDWLRVQLAEPRRGVATVVFHSVLMPFLTEEYRKNVRRVIEDAGSQATVEAPVAWLSMEPNGEEAHVRLTIWPGGELRLIARSTFHGRDVRLVG